MAFDEGRKQQEEVIAELRENLRVLATENERLDGIATGAERRAKELEQAKSAAQTELFQTRSKLEGELSRAQAALAQANAQAAQMGPYLIALVVLALLGRASRMPAAIGQPLPWDQ